MFNSAKCTNCRSEGNDAIICRRCLNTGWEDNLYNLNNNLRSRLSCGHKHLIACSQQSLKEQRITHTTLTLENYDEIMRSIRGTTICYSCASLQGIQDFMVPKLRREEESSHIMRNIINVEESALHPSRYYPSDPSGLNITDI